MKTYLSIFAAMVLVALGALPSAHARETLVFATFENAGVTLVQEPVMREAYRRLGYEIEIRQLPGERALLLADRGIVDGELARLAVVRGMYKNLIMVPEPIHELREVVITQNADFEPAGWESLKPYTVLSLRGYKYTEEKCKEHQINYQLVNRFEDMVKILHAGRYDIGLITLLDGLKTMKDMGIRDLRVLETPLETFPTYHFLHKKHENLVPLVCEKLKELKKEGFVKKIEDQIVAELRNE